MLFYIKSFLKFLFLLLAFGVMFYGVVVVAMIMESKGKLIPIILGFLIVFIPVLIGVSIFDRIKNRD